MMVLMLKSHKSESLAYWVQPFLMPKVMCMYYVVLFGNL